MSRTLSRLRCPPPRLGPPTTPAQHTPRRHTGHVSPALRCTAIPSAVLLAAAVSWSCGSRSEHIDSTRDHHGSQTSRATDPSDHSEPSGASEPSEANEPSGASEEGSSEPSNAEAHDEADGREAARGSSGSPSSNEDLNSTANLAEQAAADDSAGDRNTADGSGAQAEALAELEDLPVVDPMDADELVPLCSAPMQAELGYPTYGTEVARLQWLPESGECTFTSGDGTPDGWSPILSLRRRGEDTFLSTFGEWRYLASTDLDLDDLPEGELFTFFPYLGQWQFVVQLRYDGQLVTIEEFGYLQGEPPANYGLPNSHSNDPVPETMLVPCSSLNDEETAP